MTRESELADNNILQYKDQLLIVPFYTARVCRCVGCVCTIYKPNIEDLLFPVLQQFIIFFVCVFIK